MVAPFYISEEEYKGLLDSFSYLDERYKEIENTCKNETLTKEFAIMLKNSKELIDYIYKNQQPLVKVNIADGDFAFDIERLGGGQWYKRRGPNEDMSVVIYGVNTNTHTLSTTFMLDKIPDQDITLELKGWDCEKNIAPMLINLNGKKIFIGNSNFKHTYPFKTGPGIQTFRIPAKYFITGKNTFTLSNKAESNAQADFWICIAQVKLKF